jgi:mannose-1-phosphate guanylyltransferase
VLDHSIIDLIPGGKAVSIERQIFPILATKGELFGYKFGTLWVDIGKPEDYIEANRAMLDMFVEKNHIEKGAKVSKKAKIFPPVAIARGAVVEAGAVVGPYTSLGEGATIKKGSRVENSILFPHAWVDSSTSIKDSVIGENAFIGSWVKIESECIVGDNAMISDNVTLTSNVKVCPSKNVSESILQPSIVQ